MYVESLYLELQPCCMELTVRSNGSVSRQAECSKYLAKSQGPVYVYRGVEEDCLESVILNRHPC